jgi:non-specific serine/threonine protein kinase
LFIRHLQNNIRGFLLSAENAQTVSDVCTRLGGLPLAIELAASGVPDIESLPDMLTYLDRFLNTGNSDMLDIPQRHRTLDAAIGWSYRMLSQEEQELFCRLSVFQGQWSLQQAVGICSGDGAYGQDIQRRIDRLVACSLVIENSDTNSGKRYRFLETIRVFALAQLRNTGGEQRLRRRHRDWFLAWAEQNEPLCWGQKLPLWLEQVDLDFSNFRAALQWCVETDGEAQAGLRIWSAIERYFDLFGHSTDGQPYALALLKISPELTPARAHTLAQLGVLTRNRGDVSSAEALAEECYSAGLANGRIFDAVAALTVLGTLKQQKNEFADAEILLRQAVELAREYGLYEPVSLCISLVWLGIYYSLTGRVELAIPIFQEGLLKCEAAGEISFYAIALASLGRAYVGQNDLTTAKKCLERSMEASRQIHYYELYSYGLDYLGQIAWFEGHRESAVRLFASAVALRLQVGLATWIPDRNYDAILREAGTEINDAVQRLADSTSQDLLISKAWYKTLETYKQNDAAADTALTSREYEIAVKIKEGLSNQRIAGSLFISKRTVDAHVRNILDKLGLKTRAQISAWVAARGK